MWETARVQPDFNQPGKYVFHFVNDKSEIVGSLCRIKGSQDFAVAVDVKPDDLFRTAKATQINGFFQKLVQCFAAGEFPERNIPLGATHIVAAKFTNKLNDCGEILLGFQLSLSEPRREYLEPVVGPTINSPPIWNNPMDIRFHNGASE
jgi:hypothetical protein